MYGSEARGRMAGVARTTARDDVPSPERAV